MKVSKIGLGTLLLGILGGSASFSQEAEKTKYDAHVLFHPLFNFQPGNEFRSGSGAPGPKYWQNRADYKINVSLDEKRGSCKGRRRNFL